MLRNKAVCYENKENNWQTFDERIVMTQRLGVNA